MTYAEKCPVCLAKFDGEEIVNTTNPPVRTGVYLVIVKGRLGNAIWSYLLRVFKSIIFCMPYYLWSRKLTDTELSALNWGIRIGGKNERQTDKSHPLV